MPIPPAIDALRERRHRNTANWARLLNRPIMLSDGTVLFTLKDAAERILAMPATPSSRVAAERIIDAALHGGDMAHTQAAVRLALFKASPKDNIAGGPAHHAADSQTPARRTQISQ